jgi:FkbM family methyltransferase
MLTEPAGSTIPEEFSYRSAGNLFPVVSLWDAFRLWHRASKYAWQEDAGGIQYLCKSIQSGDTVFDIGAHKAGYLYHIRNRTGRSGKIVAFEPQQHLFQYLNRLKHRLGWNQVTIERKAVTDYNGTATLMIPSNGNQPSSPCATIIQSHEQFPIQSIEKVSTITLDMYCRQNQLKPSFLKVDTEGSELAVFRGAAELLKMYKPRLLFECEARFIGTETMHEVFSLLQTAGYTGYFIRNTSLISIRHFSAEQHQSADTGPYCNNFIFE